MSFKVLLSLILVGASETVFTFQSPRPMTMVDVIEVPRINDAQLSPDGRTVVYMLNAADWKADRKISHLWRQDVGGRAPVQLTFGDSADAYPRWSPDGKTLFFLRGGQLYLLPIDGGEPRALTRHATSVYVNPLAVGSGPAWSPDGSAVYFLATDARTADERERDKQYDESYAFEEGLKQRHLWKVVVSTSAEEKITDGEVSDLAFRVSRDGKQLVIHRAPTPLTGDTHRSEIWAVDATGQNPRVLTHNAVPEYEAELSPDNSQLLFVAEANTQLDVYYKSSLFVMPASSNGTPRMLAPDFPYDVDHAMWAPDGKSIYAVVNMGVHTEVYQFELGSKPPRALTDGQHSIQFLSIVANRLAFGIDEPTRFADLWTMPLAGGTPTRVTGVYDNLAHDFALPRQERFAWASEDGTAVEGLLYYPIGYEPGKPYPLIVQMHGGPEESDKFGAGTAFVNDYIPLLAAKGYLVLKPNYRGSTGYGNAFKRDLVGSYFRHMPGDVLAGVDALVKQGLADPDRLVLMGWSAGGTLTNKLVTMTDRFKAASSGAGAANWISMYAQSDARTFRTPWFGGTPWQRNAPIDAYWDNSPLKDVANVKTPIVFLAGELDTRVPKEQVIEMFRGVKSNGVPTHLYMAPREGHGWGGMRHELFKANVELEWFEKYAMGRAYAWEKAPGEGEKPRGTQP